MKSRLFLKLLVKTPPGGGIAHCKCPLCAILYIPWSTSFTVGRHFTFCLWHCEKD